MKLPFVPFENLLKSGVRFGFSPALPVDDQRSHARLLKLNAVQPFLLDLDQCKPIAKEAEERTRRYEVKRGMFLLNRAGKREHVGRAVLVRNDYLNYRYPDLMISFSVREDLILPDFLELYLQSEQARHYFVNQAVGSNVSMVKINRRILLNLPVFLPPLDFQKRLLPLLTNLRRLYCEYHTLNKKKRFSFIDLKTLFFSQRLAFKSASVCAWKEKDICEIFNLRNEYRKRSSETPLVVSKQLGVYPNELARKNNNSGKFVRPGDFILSLRASEGGAELSLHRGLVSPAYTVLRQKLPIVPFFYSYLFKSKNFIEKVMNTAVTGTRGDGRVDWKILGKQRVCYPSIAEQTEIAGLLSLFEQKYVLETRLEQNILKILRSLSSSVQKEYLFNQSVAQKISSVL